MKRNLMKTIHFLCLGLLALIISSCGRATTERKQHQDVAVQQADPCNDPDADIECCFRNMPANLSQIMTIEEQDDSTEKLVVSGTVYQADGKTPYPNIILYAYHTDGEGYYLKNGSEKGVQKWHGRLHGGCRTNSNGYYEIRTIRPARYPNNTMPAHIHTAIKKPSDQPYWITDFVFRNDELVDEEYLSTLTNVGGTGVVAISLNPENSWTGKRDMVLK
jgi:protocatechuate 3,4-dioxygenase beta subunit